MHSPFARTKLLIWLGVFLVVVLALLFSGTLRLPKHAIKFNGEMWSGVIESVSATTQVSPDRDQTDGWSANEHSQIIVVRGTIRPSKPTPDQDWTGDVGQLLKAVSQRERGDYALLNTRVATVDTGGGIHEMLGYITRETYSTADSKSVTWVRSIATFVPVNADVKAAMVFAVPVVAQDVTISFAGGGQVKLRITPEQAQNNQ